MRRKWTLAYGGVGVFLGILTAQLVRVYIGGHTFESAVIIGALPITIILVVVNIVQVNRKKDNTPDVDERTRHNMLKYYVYASNIFIGIAFLLLAIVTSVGIEQISVYYLWLIIFIYFAISGIGAVVISRK